MANVGVVALGAAGAFAVTNMDDIVVLTVLFSSRSATGRPTARAIVGGQVLGFIALCGISLLAAVGFAQIPSHWIGLLGLVPLALGVKGIVEAIRVRPDDDDTEEDSASTALTVYSVAAITFANGADNISIYTPLFLTVGGWGSAVTVIVFAVGLALWFLVARFLGTRKVVLRIVERIGSYLIPALFVIVGILVLSTLRG